MNERDVEGRQQREGGVTKAVAGMRGGLGRILLTAFMLLAIVPLSIISFVAIRRVRADIREGAVENLSYTASSVGAQLESWLSLRQGCLALLAKDTAFVRAVEDRQWDLACSILEAAASGCDLAGFSVGFPSAGSSTPLTACSASERDQSQALSSLVVTADVIGKDGRALGITTASADLTFDRVESTFDVPAGARVLLLDGEGAPLVSLAPFEDSAVVRSSSDFGMSIDGQAGSGFVTNASGEAAAVAYQWLPGHEIGVWVERPEAAIRAQEDDFAAMLIGGTLAVALLTAVLAAVITRQLTQPIVSLTQSAVRIAGGDLTQTVDLVGWGQSQRRDEIGVLARAFNVMTGELRSLYQELEHKVAERTRQLVEANLELRYKAMQLKLSAEIGQIATSILDLDLLLYRVTNLIQETYGHVYDVQYVAIWLQDEFGERLERQSFRGHAPDVKQSAIAVGSDSVLGQIAKDGQLWIGGTEVGGTRVVIALRIGDRTIGALDLRCAQRGALGPDDVEALQSLGDQVSVAIENARLYSAERDAVERLSRLDDLRLASLSSGSRELATELNTIIGFSRLVLKGIDGPLTDLQRADLQAIYRSGYKLLGLIDNVITLSEVEGGSPELDCAPVDMDALLSDVLRTAAPRLPDVVVDYYVEQPLPAAWGDVSLLRQAFVGLVMAAADQLLGKLVHVHAYPGKQGEDGLCVEIVGSPQPGGSARDEPDVASTPSPEHRVDESGVGVALAQEVIALHGGTLDLAFHASRGLHCRVELPAEKTTVEKARS